MQTRYNELTSQPRDFIDKTLQSLTIQLRRGIIEQQRRSDLEGVLKKPQLGDSHRHCDQFLLAARQHVPGRPAVKTYGDIGAVGTSLRLPSQLIARTQLDECLCKGAFLAPAAQVR